MKMYSLRPLCKAFLQHRPDQPLLVLSVVENLVDDDASAEDSDDIFAFDDFNAVGIGEGEHVLVDVGDDAAVTVESEIVFPEGAFDAVIVGARDIEGEAFAEPAPFLDHFGKDRAVNDYLITRHQGEQLLVDQGEFTTGSILEGQGIAPGEYRTLDLETSFIGLVVDSEVVAKGPETLSDTVDHVSLLFLLPDIYAFYSGADEYSNGFKLSFFWCPFTLCIYCSYTQD